MPENTIAMIRSEKGNGSQICTLWILHLEERYGIVIQHSACGGEKFLFGRFVDGYREDANGVKYVYEVNNQRSWR